MAPFEDEAKAPAAHYKLLRSVWPLAALLLLAALGGRLTDALILIALVLSHEAVHLAVAAGLGAKVTGWRILPIGGELALAREFAQQPGVEALVALAGPLHHLLLLAIAPLAGAFTAALGAHGPFFVRANWTLAVFNLLPIHPLDGGRILHAGLLRARGAERAGRSVQIWSRWAACFLTGAGLLAAVWGYGPWLLLCGFFLCGENWRRRLDYSLPAHLRLQAQKRRRLTAEGALRLRGLAVGAESGIWETLQRFSGRHYEVFCLLDKGGAILRLVTEEEALAALVQHGLDAKFACLANAAKQGRRWPAVVE